MIVKHFDAKTAFLNGELKEDLYMQQPEGFVVNGKENLVCKLNKSIYGLKQSAKAWNEKVNEVLRTLDFEKSDADPCLYSKFIDGSKIHIVIFVDDFLIAGKDIKIINVTEKLLAQFFEITDLGLIHQYLSIRIQRNSKGIYCLDQLQYIEKF